MINIAITGGDSFAAGELTRILINHPDCNIRWIASNKVNGLVANYHKGLWGECELAFSSPSVQDIDVVFCCDNDGAQWCQQARKENDRLRIIDIAGALTSTNDTMYGLCEINRKFMVHDCYNVVTMPTPQAMVTLLALVPLAKNLMIGGDISVDMSYPTIVKPVANLAQEIATVITALQTSFNHDINITTAVNHNSTRGITATVTLTCDINIATVKELYNQYYDDHNFTFITDQDIDTSHVINTNKCLLHLSQDKNSLSIKAVADAMLKGGAGNAVHAMNLLFGLHERTALALKAQVI